MTPNQELYLQLLKARNLLVNNTTLGYTPKGLERIEDDLLSVMDSVWSRLTQEEMNQVKALSQ